MSHSTELNLHRPWYLLCAVNSGHCRNTSVSIHSDFNNLLCHNSMGEGSNPQPHIRLRSVQSLKVAGFKIIISTSLYDQPSKSWCTSLPKRHDKYFALSTFLFCTKKAPHYTAYKTGVYLTWWVFFLTLVDYLWYFIILF